MRVLDSACGSGTFVVEAARRLVKHLETKEQCRTLPETPWGKARLARAKSTHIYFYLCVMFVVRLEERALCLSKLKGEIARFFHKAYLKYVSTLI